jgi:stage V sporulation protein D (sporulation-specific penicillin-binding protein)
MLGRTDSRPRLTFLAAALLVLASVLVARLAWWQVIVRDQLAAAAHRQTHIQTALANQRGSIFDRSGVTVLATTVDRSRVVAAANLVDPAERSALAADLGAALGLDDAAVQAMVDKLRTAKPYVVLARDVDATMSEHLRAEIAAGNLPNISLETESARVYPQAGGGPDTSLAAQLLGFVNRDGQGQYGIEQFYQDQLAGSPTVVEAEKDANGRPIADTEHVVRPGIPGADLTLTIDAGLQLAVEQEALAAWIADGAASVSAIVMDPYTGEVLASSTYPSYDANNYPAVATQTPERFIDPTVSKVYEPGSVFKMLTAIAGLESGTLTPLTEFEDTGTLKLDGGKTQIDDADHKALGPIAFRDGIALSRNVVAARAAMGLAPTVAEAAADLYGIWLRMGFGADTGIDVSGEVPGIMRDPAISAWREIDLANGAFGQGVAVTPIQLATAYSAMVNGGTLVTPHVVRSLGSTPVAPPARARVMDAATSATLTSLMRHVVESVPYYSTRTLIPGLVVGGKTGTAQIWDSSRGEWKAHVFNFSFIGYVGREVSHPDFVIAVEIHEGRPTVRRLGQIEMPVMSFELFRRIATDAMTTPGLLPERSTADPGASGQ